MNNLSCNLSKCFNTSLLESYSNCSILRERQFQRLLRFFDYFISIKIIHIIHYILELSFIIGISIVLVKPSKGFRELSSS